MKKLKVGLSIGFVGADHHDEIEVEDDATPEDMQQALADWAGNYIDYWYEVAE